MYERYGTWTTFDSPANDKHEEAFEWLSEKFSEIGGFVWIKQNDHDFGTYPSFEVNKPRKYDDLIECDEICGECEDCELERKYDKWVDKANEIEKEYSSKFFSSNN